LPFSVFAMCTIFIVIIAQFWMEIFDVILQMNVSRSHTMPIMTEYFVDQEKYFYFILLCTYITVCVTIIITLAIGTTFITFFQHIYGMFKIARYKNKSKNKSWKKFSKIQCTFKIYYFKNKIKKIYKEHILLCKHISHSIYL